MVMRVDVSDKCISKTQKSNAREKNIAKISGQRDAEECQSDRSRQAFSNKYLIQKSGVDAAENEPKVSLKWEGFPIIRWFDHAATAAWKLRYASIPHEDTQGM